MTVEQFKILEFEADRKFAFFARKMEREIRRKYARLMNLGFHTTAGRIVYQEQLLKSMEREIKTSLETLRGDIEAEFFGTLGKRGVQQLMQSTPKIILFPPQKKPATIFKTIK